MRAASEARPRMPNWRKFVIFGAVHAGATVTAAYFAGAAAHEMLMGNGSDALDVWAILLLLLTLPALYPLLVLNVVQIDGLANAWLFSSMAVLNSLIVTLLLRMVMSWVISWAAPRTKHSDNNVN